jgi:DNA-binding transcriptional LysR family regulator
MTPLVALQVFVRVAELSSFTRAAEVLGMPKASMTLAVQQLEAQLGTRLLHRTTRRVELTQDGRAFYERSKDVLADVDELQSMFQQSPAALRGRLRVDMPQKVARNFVIPQLPAFLAKHPQLEIELSSADRKVDLVREGFDCVLRVGSIDDPNLVARPLGRYRMANCASPAYLQRHGTPRSLEDLARHRLVHYAPTWGAKLDGFEWFDGASYRSLPMAGAIVVNNTDAYEACCVAGLGIIQVPAVGVKRLLESGELLEVLPDLRAEPMPVSFVYAHRRNLSPRVRTFVEWMTELMAPHLEPA